MSDKLEFLEQTQAEMEQPEEVTEQAEAPAPEQEAAPEPEPQATGETDAGTPPAVEEKDQRIPITALLDEREKRQRIEREAEQARRELAQLRQQFAALQQPKKAPDFFEKPEEAVRHQVEPLAQQIIGVKLEQSRFLAERDYGSELVEEVTSFFDENPQLSRQFLSAPSPFHAAVDFYKRAKVLQKIEGDPEQWINSQVEARLNERLAAVQSSPAKPAAPPPSLARAPAAGGGESMKPGSAFDALPIR
jgi:hypothetical protein